MGRHWLKILVQRRSTTDMAGTIVTIGLALMSGTFGGRPVAADTIRLKNGNSIEGDVVQSNDQEITVEIPQLGKMTLQREEIASIEGVVPETRAVNGEIENAAVFYSKAFALLQYPASQGLKDAIQATIKNGWQGENQELERILDQNETALREFQKARPVKRCDFQFGKETKYVIDRAVPPVTQIRDLFYLALLSARQDESRGSFQSALEKYLSTFTLAGHVAQDPSLVAKMIAVGIEEGVSVPLRDRIESAGSGPEECGRIADFVWDYRATRFPVTELIAPVREDLVSAVQLAADRMRPQQALNEQQEKKVRTFQDAFLKQGQDLIGKHVDLLLQAAKTNQDTDWATTEREFENLKQELQGTFGRELQMQLLQFAEAMKPQVIKPDSVPETLAASFAKIVLAIALPNLRPGVTRYYEAEQKLKELHVLAARKAR